MLREKFRRIDQSPVNVFQCLGSVWDAGQILLADSEFLWGWSPSEGLLVEGWDDGLVIQLLLQETGQRSLAGRGRASVHQGAIDEQKSLRDGHLDFGIGRRGV